MAYPQDIRVIKVELWINSAWVNISPYVQQDGAGTINRGAGGEDQSMPPTVMSLNLVNDDGRFTQENPLGPYYPYLQQSTLLRYRIEDGGLDYSRFYGEVAEWPTSIGAHSSDNFVQVEASNIFARWERGDTLESPMRRTISTIPSLVAYWPLEDEGENAQTLVSAIPGKPAMTVKAAVDVAGYSGFLASKPVVNMGAGYIEGVVAAYVATGNQDILWLTGGPVDNIDTTIIQVETTGTMRFVSILAHTNGDLRIRIYNTEGTIISTSAYAGTHNFNAKDVSIRLILAQNGTGVDWRIGVRDQLDLTGETITTGTFATQTLGRISKVKFGHFNNLDCPVGHAFVANGGIGAALLDLSFSVLGGYAGETSGDRFLRNCVEQGISARIIGDPGDTPRMGPQPIGTIKAILEDAANVGEAIIFESRDELGVTMLTLEALYNQSGSEILSPAITVTASTGLTTTLQVSDTRAPHLWPGVEFKIYNSADFTEWDPQLLTVTVVDEEPSGYVVTYTPATASSAGTSERVLVHRRSLLALDYSNHEIQPPAQPRRDSRLTTNHVTLSRPGGSEYTAVEETGPRSVQEPPNGIGLFKESDTVNVYSDGQLAPQAEWRKAVGVNNDARWSNMEIALHHASMAARQAELLAFDIGHKITLDNAASIHIYDQMRQLARGYTEVFDGNRLHSITVNAVPETPFHILEFDSAALDCRWAGDNTALGEAIDSTQTGAVDVTSGQTIWTTDAADFPMDVMVGGERITVSDINGGYDAPTFVGVGTADADTGTNTLTPGMPAGVVSGDVVFILLSTNASGWTVTGSSGWSFKTFGSVNPYPDMLVLYRVYDGVWTMPSLAFTTGGASDPVLARAFAFRGINPVGPVTLANFGTAGWQNIPLAGRSPDIGVFDSVLGQGGLWLSIGYKSDDWSSIIWPGVCTEIFRQTTTLGTDASQTAGYVIGNTHGLVAEGSESWVSVTGGTIGTAFSALLYFAPDPQEFVISARSVNGVVKSHSAGAPVDVADPFYYGL